jgi:hypothetical protein
MSARAVPRSYKEDNLGNQISSVTGSAKKKSVGREPPFREDLSAEAEESPLLQAVTRERLVIRQHVGRDLVCVVVICKMWRLAMVL